MLHLYPPDLYPQESPSEYYLTIPRIKNVIFGHHWDTSFPPRSLSRIPEGHVSCTIWSLERRTLKNILLNINFSCKYTSHVLDRESLSTGPVHFAHQYSIHKKELQQTWQIVKRLLDCKILIQEVTKILLTNAYMLTHHATGS